MAPPSKVALFSKMAPLSSLCNHVIPVWEIGTLCVALIERIFFLVVEKSKIQTESQETLNKSPLKDNIHHLWEIAFHNTPCTLRWLHSRDFL